MEALCEDLEKRHHFPFFDKCPLSLPIRERFPKLILDACKQCRMAVVVVSHDYFVSRWPMIELYAFVQASKTNTKLKILPLFYGLSVAEFATQQGKRNGSNCGMIGQRLMNESKLRSGSML